MSSAAVPAYLLARRVTRVAGLPFVVARRDRDRAVDHALVVPADRGRGLPGVRLGAARHRRRRSRGRRCATTCSRSRRSRSRCSHERSSTSLAVVLAVRDRGAGVDRAASARDAPRARALSPCLRGRPPRSARGLIVERPHVLGTYAPDRERQPAAARDLRLRAGAPGRRRSRRRLAAVSRRRRLDRRRTCSRERDARAAGVRVAGRRDDRRAHGRGGVVRPSLRRRRSSASVTSSTSRRCSSSRSPPRSRPHRLAAMVAARPARAPRDRLLRAPLPTFEKLNVDTPASILDDWLLRRCTASDGARIFLIARRGRRLRCSYVEATVLLPRDRSSLGICALAARRAAGRDGLRVQAALRRQRHVRAAADARPEPRLRVGRPHDHDELAS